MDNGFLEVLNGSQKKCFFVPVENRTKDTLLEIIQKWILPGTTIMSDCWKSYDCLADEGFQHEAVNHSKNFVDPDTGAHTQNIERCWRDVRAGIPRFGRPEQHFDGYLVISFVRNILTIGTGSIIFLNA
ncbi:hypothetical protein NQ314_016516 [Rhamnusium bicolor]|uniref:ISXO2-like transposase domain-containing protein n=1 Tax=Rhamnusium bicolor TaxID=1586634 RepID=A0AAV8WW09_9CUCU|nr:hypothetical protein NQ314_016516 [Rhamnusium bicolor]